MAVFCREHLYAAVSLLRNGVFVCPDRCIIDLEACPREGGPGRNEDAMTAAAMPEDLGLRIEASLCGSGTCPTIYSSNRDTVVVQGFPVAPAAAGVPVPDGEFLVEIPVNILMEAAEKHAARFTA
jgi:hypothetical protein